MVYALKRDLLVVDLLEFDQLLLIFYASNCVEGMRVVVGKDYVRK